MKMSYSRWFKAVYTGPRTSIPMLLLIALAVGLLGGCGTFFGIRDPNLHLQIKPYPPVRGKPALFILDAPMKATKVEGVLEIFTSPSFRFKKSRKKGYWYISHTIPVNPLVPAGTYKVRLSYILPGEVPRYTELKLELK